MHVAPDVVTAVERYVDVTDDHRFLIDHGAEIAFEVARFLWSFVRYDEMRGVYHCIRLLGPDEWHENVDDNAFTNHQARRALAFAVATYAWMEAEHPAALESLADRIDLDPGEVDRWRRVRDAIHLPAPDPRTGLIEQFTGFFDLEDVRPDALRERLLDPTEYWGWPNGVAVATQVSKQADVPMLLWLHRTEYSDAVKRANYDYYEPRCSHNSSLSHAAFGMVAADLGDAATAYEHFRGTALVDLLNTNHPVVGGTFIGGIHTAACGGTLQLVVEGMGGLDFVDGAISIDPALPEEWTSLTYPVSWRGNRLIVEVAQGSVTVTAGAHNPDVVELVVRGNEIEVAPGDAAVVG
jgi:kojibiose phosphorylase